MLWLWMHYLLFLLVVGYALSLFYLAVYHRYMSLKLGQPADRHLDWGMRAKDLVSQVLGHQKLLKTAGYASYRRYAEKLQRLKKIGSQVSSFSSLPSSCSLYCFRSASSAYGPAKNPPPSPL